MTGLRDVVAVKVEGAVGRAPGGVASKVCGKPKDEVSLHAAASSHHQLTTGSTGRAPSNTFVLQEHSAPVNLGVRRFLVI